MRRAEIARKFDEIVAFAEVEKFIDTPVKHYSSGMYMRLAFAVAAHLEPEILIVDEVLAVGDAQFQKKCLGKIGDVARGGRTVLFVSHNMAAIRALCSVGILLRDGALAHTSSLDDAVGQYAGFADRPVNGEDLKPSTRTEPGSCSRRSGAKYRGSTESDALDRGRNAQRHATRLRLSRVRRS